MAKVFDVFPFFNELDVLEIRLNEMDKVADHFVILECAETYGGQPKNFHLSAAMRTGRFDKFKDKITLMLLHKLEPACTDRTTGRLREAYQRNMMMPMLAKLCAPDDVVVFSDCDEIPNADTVKLALPRLVHGVARLKQRSFYYTVNRLADYGHDWASRARVAHWRTVEECGTMYAFRMAKASIELENGGWHFGYFGTGIDHIKNKVATLSPFLNEYKLFGDAQLVRDIVGGKDLHHRKCEMPETFTRTCEDDPTLPAYFLANRGKFAHFTERFYRERYRDLL